MYYVLPLNHFKEIGSSDLLRFASLSVRWVQLGGDLGLEATSGRWGETAAVFTHHR